MSFTQQPTAPVSSPPPADPMSADVSELLAEFGMLVDEQSQQQAPLVVIDAMGDYTVTPSPALIGAYIDDIRLPTTYLSQGEGHLAATEMQTAVSVFQLPPGTAATGGPALIAANGQYGDGAPTGSVLHLGGNHYVVIEPADAASAQYVAADGQFYRQSATVTRGDGSCLLDALHIVKTGNKIGDDGIAAVRGAIADGIDQLSVTTTLQEMITTQINTGIAPQGLGEATRALIYGDPSVMEAQFERQKTEQATGKANGDGTGEGSPELKKRKTGHDEDGPPNQPAMGEAMAVLNEALDVEPSEDEDVRAQRRLAAAATAASMLLAGPLTLTAPKQRTSERKRPRGEAPGGGDAAAANTLPVSLVGLLDRNFVEGLSQPKQLGPNFDAFAALAAVKDALAPVYAKVKAGDAAQGVVPGFDDPLTEEDLDDVLFIIRCNLIGAPKKGGGGGGGTLDIEVTDHSIAIGGRPGWTKGLAEQLGRGKGEALRHITPWHSIKAAFGNLANGALAEAGVAGLRQALEALKQAAVPPPPESGDVPMREPDDKKAVEALVKELLTALNSNKANLWPGQSYQNSLINVYQQVFGNWKAELASSVPPVDDGSDAGWRAKVAGWVDGKLKLLAQRATDNSNADFARTLQSARDILSGIHADLTAAVPEGYGSYPPPQLVAELGKLMQSFQDSFEYDHPYEPDRQRLGPGHEVTTDPAVAKRILQWADGAPADAGSAREELVHIFTAFMQPAGGTTKGKPG